MKTSQAEAILNHLKRGKPLTPRQAIEKFDCYRLAARIRDLRGRGHDILTEKKKGQRNATYRMA
jgi:hypothetical protein